MKTVITGYWTFFCSPAKWQIDRFLSTNIERDNYMIADWQSSYFAPGQVGVIRVGIDNRTKKQLGSNEKLLPGVYAIVEIEGAPEPRQLDNDGLWLQEEPQAGSRLSVPIRYIANLLTNPILLSQLNLNSSAHDKYLIDGFQSASMPLNPLAFQHIIELSGRTEQVFDEVQRGDADSINAIEELEQRYRYASPVVRKAISRRIERGAIAQKIKKLTGYRCLVCEALGLSPIGFLKPNGEPYIEVHHIIPVAELTEGLLGIANLLTVCPNHHRELHFGKVSQLNAPPEQLRIRLDERVIEIKRFAPSIIND
jgi:hypothetical protein